MVGLIFTSIYTVYANTSTGIIALSLHWKHFEGRPTTLHVYLSNFSVKLSAYEVINTGQPAKGRPSKTNRWIQHIP